MNLDELDCRQMSGGITVKVKVQPRASRNTLAGISGDSLRLSLTSPPVDGAANAACIEFFADLCRVAKGQVAIVSGQKSREKRISITGIDKTGFLVILKGKYQFD